MVNSINLIKQIPDKQLRKEVVRVFYGIVPNNGKTYSIKSISENENYYRKLSDSLDKKSSKK